MENTLFSQDLEEPGRARAGGLAVADAAAALLPFFQQSSYGDALNVTAAQNLPELLLSLNTSVAVNVPAMVRAATLAAACSVAGGFALCSQWAVFRGVNPDLLHSSQDVSLDKRDSGENNALLCFGNSSNAKSLGGKESLIRFVLVLR